MSSGKITTDRNVHNVNVYSMLINTVRMFRMTYPHNLSSCVWFKRQGLILKCHYVVEKLVHIPIIDIQHKL